MVFGNAARLEVLNGLVHPRVGHDSAGWAAQQQGAAYVLKEAALLYESGAYRELDYVVVVAAPLAVRQARVLHRDPQRSAAEVQAIIGKQLSEEEKVERADFVIRNDGVQPVLPQVLALHRQFGAATAA